MPCILSFEANDVRYGNIYTGVRLIFRPTPVLLYNIGFTNNSKSTVQLHEISVMLKPVCFV